MEEKFVTLAIHTSEKARILKMVLESEGIDVQIQAIDGDANDITPGVRVRIQQSNLARALNIVESHRLFRYDDEETLKNDDGRVRILVPVDFSKYSMKACQVAFNLARDINAKVKIMNVYFNPYYPTALPMADAFAYQAKGDDEFKSVIDKVRDNIQRLCKDIDDLIAKGELPSVNYSYVLREGVPEEEIVNYTKEYRPSLLVMGTRGKDQKDADLIGSVTAEVIEMCRVPLIAMPENAPFSDLSNIKKIGFLTSFTQRDLISFESVAKLLAPFNLEIDLTHIATGKKKESKWDEMKLEGVKTYFSKQYPTLKLTYSLIASDDLVKALDQHVKSNNIELLALTTTRRNIFARMFNPSISRRMLFHSDTPLLVMRGV